MDDRQPDGVVVTIVQRPSKRRAAWTDSTQFTCQVDGVYRVTVRVTDCSDSLFFQDALTSSLSFMLRTPPPFGGRGPIWRAGSRSWRQARPSSESRGKGVRVVARFAESRSRAIQMRRPRVRHFRHLSTGATLDVCWGDRQWEVSGAHEYAHAGPFVITVEIIDTITKRSLYATYSRQSRPVSR